MIFIQKYDKNLHKISGKILLDLELESDSYITNFTDKMYLEPIYDMMIETSDDNFLSGNAQIYLYFNDKELIGFIVSFFSKPYVSTFIPSYLDNGKYYIASLFVKTRYQNLGIGTKLINTVILNAKNQNIKEILLTVNQNNIKGIQFYKKREFVEKKQIKDVKLIMLEYKVI